MVNILRSFCKKTLKAKKTFRWTKSEKRENCKFWKLGGIYSKQFQIIISKYKTLLN